MDEERFIKMCPYCAICGDRITEDFLRIGYECYHEDCVEKVNIETYVENEGMNNV